MGPSQFVVLLSGNSKIFVEVPKETYTYSFHFISNQFVISCFPSIQQAVISIKALA